MIETKRLILRSLRDGDLDSMTAALNNLNVSQTTARIPFPYTSADAENFLALNKKPMDGTLHLAIVRKDSNDRVCGGISYESGESVELGYWLAEAEWGQGLGGEAARAMTDHAFDVARHEALNAGYAVGNEASRRILERLGFAAIEARMVFSKSVGAEVPVMRMRLSRAKWELARARMQKDMRAS